MQDWCLFGSGREILEQIADTSSLVALSVYLQKKQLDRQCSEIFSVPLHQHFSLYCNPRLFMFPLPSKTDGYRGQFYH